MNCDFHRIGKDKYQCAREGCKRVVETSAPQHRIFARCHGIGESIEQQCRYLGKAAGEVGYILTRCGKGSVKVALFRCEKFGLCALSKKPEDHISCAQCPEWTAKGETDADTN